MENSTESLNEKLYFLQKKIAEQSTPELNALTEEAIAELTEFDVATKSLKINDIAPSHKLKNAVGNEFLFSPDSLDKPTIVLFYRGGWCPYCNVELHYYQEHLDEIKVKGCDLIAISPELPDNSLTLKEKENLEFEILSDLNCELAQKFGIAAKRPTAFTQMLGKLGLVLEDSYGAENDFLPIPSKFLIDSDGKILHRAFNPNYRERAELTEVLGKLS